VTGALLTMLGILAIGLLAPALANASPPPTPPGFTLQGSNGYSIFVFGSPAHSGERAEIGIVVTGRHSVAFYTAPATATETSIQADLGDLGEIAVAFHPSGRARTVRPGCGDNEPVSFDSGHYEGTIAFHGEEGYTNVEASRAQGDLGFLLRIVCPGISVGTGGPFLPGAKLQANSSSRFGAKLTVIKNRPGARAHFEAGISEKHDGISIGRFVERTASAGTFGYDPKIRSATVRPPPPFSGTARFRRAARPAGRWTGDLTVDLPGRANVKLAGSDFRTRLVHTQSTK
jgi:hypothetical protein